MSVEIPSGFVKLHLKGVGFLQANGPLYGKWVGEYFHLGFRVEDRHCNPAQMCHGGMLMTFADMQIPLAGRLQSKIDPGMVPTVNLSTDYLAPAPLGSWVEGQTDVLRTTRNLMFGQCIVTANGEPCLRASGIFKISKSNGDIASLENIIGNGLRRLDRKSGASYHVLSGNLPRHKKNAQ